MNNIKKLQELRDSISLGNLINQYYKFFLLSMLSLIFIFFIYNFVVWKEKIFTYQASVGLFSIPEISIPKIESDNYTFKQNFDDMGLDLFSFNKNPEFKAGYGKFYNSIEQTLDSNLNILEKFKNFPVVFVQFLRLENNTDKISNLINADSYKVVELEITHGFVKILNVDLKIEGLSTDSVKNFLHDKVTNSAKLFNKFMSIQVEKLRNDLIYENQFIQKKVAEALNLRIDYLERQLLIAHQEDIKNPIQATITPGTEYLKGVNLLELEISESRKDIKNLMDGNHYLLYTNALLISSLEDSIFFRSNFDENNEFIYTFFYDKNLINVTQKINSTILNYFVYYLIFSFVIILISVLMHFYLFKKEEN